MKFSGWFSSRLVAKSLATRSPVDLALAGFGVSAAAGSVVFAATMFAHGDRLPMVNGMEYLGVFGQPHRHLAVVAAIAPPPVAAAAKPAKSEGGAPTRASSSQPIDLSPVGAIARADAPPEGDPYRLVAVEAGIAWLRNGVETRVVKPGDVAPGLGRIAAIVRRDGRWTLLDDSGAVLLAADPPDPGHTAVNPFSRRMIFGGD